MRLRGGWQEAIRSHGKGSARDGHGVHSIAPTGGAAGAGSSGMNPRRGGKLVGTLPTRWMRYCALFQVLSFPFGLGCSARRECAIATDFDRFLESVGKEMGKVKWPGLSLKT